MLQHPNWLQNLGRYSFSASQPGEGLRPLRDPDAADDDPQEPAGGTLR